MVLWNALFVFFPHSEWILRHHDLRVSVSVVFLVIIVFMWFRVTHAHSVIPAMRLVCVSMLVRADPRFEAELRGDPESRHVMRELLNKLLAHEKKRETSKTSVIRYLVHKAKRQIGYSNKIRFSRRVFHVLRDLYNEGLMAEWSPDPGRPQPMQSERRFVSYFVYRLIQRLMIAGKTVALFLERLIFSYPKLHSE
jgi:hypothetical protein